MRNRNPEIGKRAVLSHPSGVRIHGAGTGVNVVVGSTRIGARANEKRIHHRRIAGIEERGVPRVIRYQIAAIGSADGGGVGINIGGGGECRSKQRNENETTKPKPHEKTIFGGYPPASFVPTGSQVWVQLDFVGNNGWW